MRSLLILLALWSSSLWAAPEGCYWLRLVEFSVERVPDLFGKGDFQPLLALEAGELYSLGDADGDEVESGSIPGYWFYLPAHLMEDGRFALRFMLIDRDDGTDDDLVLPMRTHYLPLPQGSDGGGGTSVRLSESYVSDSQLSVTNHMEFVFEIETREGSCYGLSETDRANDRANRAANRMHHLLNRIKHYLRKPLVAGWESDTFTAVSCSSREGAYVIAQRNLHELIALGDEVYALAGADHFAGLAREFARLIRTLQSKTITVSYTEEVDGGKAGAQTRKVEFSVPALASDPGWAGWKGGSEGPFELPAEWLAR